MQKTNNKKRHAVIATERHRDSNQGTLYISSGLPGAGKSTFLKKIKKEEEVIISRDEIRFSMLKEGDDYFKYEDRVYDIFISKIVKNLKAGKNVYADATHLTPQSQLKLLASVLHEAAPPRVELICFTIPLLICLERNEKRVGTQAYCPIKVIRKMATYINLTPCSYIDTTWIVDENNNVSKLEV